MKEKFEAVKKAIDALQTGKMVLLTDDIKRENEADLIFAAEYVSEDSIRFMMQHTCGIICLSMTQTQANQLGLKLLLNSEQNTNQHRTPFAMSFEAREGVTTGISAQDRTMTIRAAMKESATSADIVSPGHVFPLIAQDKGVFDRAGHTEGSVDLMKIAYLKPNAVICELMNPDGSVAKGKQVQHFAAQHQIPIISIQEIIQYRLAHENWVSLYSQAKVMTQQYGELILSVFKDLLREEEIVVIHSILNPSTENALIRLHSSCFTGDVLGSNLCDCGEQLDLALKKIIEEQGLLIYLPQEGRGIGLGNKIKAYALQAGGLDTVEANQSLGFKADERNYATAAQILKSLGLDKIRLLSNNPLKIEGLEEYGITVSQRVALEIKGNPHNACYLKTKKNKLNHLLSL